MSEPRVVVREVTIVFTRDRDEFGLLWAVVEEFPGLFAFGEDFDELRRDLAQAIREYLSGGGVFVDAEFVSWIDEKVSEL